MPVLGLSGTFDEQLWLDQAILVSTEGRALHNKAERTFIFAAGGLTYFSPDINIFRCGPTCVRVPRAVAWPGT